LIGSNYIMHLNITFHILLHPLNMHAQSHQGQKPLYGTLPVDLQLRNIQITHNNQTVEAAPYKLSTNDTLSNTKHIINQNNFTNTNLNTLGKQLTRLKKQIQRTTTSSVGTKTSTDLKLKNPVFKPYQITKTSQTQIQENHTDFLKAIKTHLQHLDRSSLIVQDTPQIKSTLYKMAPGSLLMKVLLQTNLLP